MKKGRGKKAKTEKGQKRKKEKKTNKENKRKKRKGKSPSTSPPAASMNTTRGRFWEPSRVFG